MPTHDADLSSAQLDLLPIFSFHRRIVWSVGFVFFFELGDINTLSFASPAILQNWKMGVQTLGLIIAATFFGMFLGALVGGRLADLMGRKRVLVIATVWFSLASLANAIVWDPTSLFVARFLTGIGLSAMTAVGITYIVEMFPAAKRGQYHAFVVTIGLFGIPVTAYIASLIIPAVPWGWRLLFVWGGLAAAFPFFSRWLEESPRWLEKKGRVREAQEIMRRIIAAAPVEKRSSAIAPLETYPPSPAVTGLTGLFGRDVRPATVLFASIWILQTLGFYGFMSWAPALLVRHGFTLANSLNWTALIQLGAVPGALAASAISDFWQRKWWLVIASLAIAVFGIGYGRSNQPEEIVAFGFLIAMSIQAFAALLYPYTAESFPTQVRSVGTGFSYGIGRLANTIGPQIIAVVIMNYSYEAVFVCISACWILASLIILLFGPRTRAKAL